MSNQLSPVLSADRENGNVDGLISLLLDSLPNEKGNKLTQLKEILSKCSSKVADLISAEQQKSIVDMTTETEVILKIPDAQFIEPRGKFEASLNEAGLYLTGNSGACVVNWHQISHIVLLPNPTPSKKEGEKYLFLILSTPVTFKTKKQTILCWSLPNGGPTLQAQYGPVHFTGKASEVVSGLTEALYSHPICRPNRARFQTSTGQSFLRCFKGVQEGTLFPLEQGILFFKPCVFIPSDQVASIAAGRGGSALTRYIDLKIETEDDKTYEFSNIDREELPSIQQYVQFYAEQRKREEKTKREAERSLQSSVGGGLDEEDDDEEDDEDFDPDAAESSQGEGGGDGSDSEASSGDDESEDDEEGHRDVGQGRGKRKEKDSQALKKKAKSVVVVDLDDEEEEQLPKLKKARS